MKLKELDSSLIEKSCIVHQTYTVEHYVKGSHKGEKSIEEELYITDIKEAYFSTADGYYILKGTVFSITRDPDFDEDDNSPFYDINLSYDYLWGLNKQSYIQPCLDDADFTFASKEEVVEKLKEKIGSLMIRENNTPKRDDSREYILIRNKLSGKEFKALNGSIKTEHRSPIVGVYNTFIYTCLDKKELDKARDCFNYDIIINSSTNKIVRELNESIEIFRINDDGSCLKIGELLSAWVQKIDYENFTIYGSFDWQIFNSGNDEGKELADNFSKISNSETYYSKKL